MQLVRKVYQLFLVQSALQQKTDTIGLMHMKLMKTRGSLTAF